MTLAQDIRSLGRVVRAARIRAGLLQRDLARQIGVPSAWLSKLENGQITGAGYIRYPERLETVRRWLREQASGHDGSTGG